MKYYLSKNDYERIIDVFFFKFSKTSAILIKTQTKNGFGFIRHHLLFPFVMALFLL